MIFADRKKQNILSYL